MTEPTRDALHEATETWLKNKRDSTTGGERSRRILAHAAACVKRVPELEAEVERLRAKAAIVDAMEFYADDANNLRALPDIPWGIGGKSGAEHVAEWREDLAARIERYLEATNGK